MTSIAARAAGAVAIGVLSGPNGADALAPHADALIPSVMSLSDWLCSHSAEGLTFGLDLRRAKAKKST